MRDRKLLTVYDVIVDNYNIEEIGEGHYLHTFTTKTTGNKFEYEGKSIEIVEENERYNIGYEKIGGRNIIALHSLSKVSSVNKNISYNYAKQIASEDFNINKQKNDDRVSHSASDGYYWGKKYAWRAYGGIVIAKEAFFNYLDEINHPSVSCITDDPDKPFAGNESIAYKDEGLEEKLDALIETAEKSGKRFYKSELYSKKFIIKGIKAITDKK
ncbi:hypothetical protein [Kangiella shandongensis]|uniref:hypothetical protein n=1 Tax=Kangiella shandongensis TaxID=2763258 RepID=UPI001CC0E40C|nr:hypothetical protein [Kangiella shandongensis]